jgi:hypothetical protein
MYDYWQAEIEAGRTPKPSEIAEECGVTIHAARRAVGRYRASRVPVPKTPGSATTA